MIESYRIDEAARRVYVTRRGVQHYADCLPFDHLAGVSSRGIAEGRDLPWLEPARAALYAAARDELVRRGLIHDPKEGGGG